MHAGSCADVNDGNGDVTDTAETTGAAGTSTTMATRETAKPLRSLCTFPYAFLSIARFGLDAAAGALKRDAYLNDPHFRPATRSAAAATSAPAPH